MSATVQEPELCFGTASSEQNVRLVSLIRRHGLFVIVVAETILAAALAGYVVSGIWL